MTLPQEIVPFRIRISDTLEEALDQAEILFEVKPEQVFVDRGYQGIKIAGFQVWKSGQKCGDTRVLRPTIGHMKADGKLGHNWLKSPRSNNVVSF